MTVAKEPLGTLDSTTTVGERPGTADGLEAPLPEKTAAGAGSARRLDAGAPARAAPPAPAHEGLPRRIRDRAVVGRLCHLRALVRPLRRHFSNILTTNLAPSAAHWFGTDSVGQDVLSRVIVGARDILEIAPLATLLGTVSGTAVGLAQGYLGGIFDMLAGRVVDAAALSRR